ncbi:Mite allergen Der p 3 [Folsomia candida]|uniref:limulus clotting factor C n=1 Tax=Folsomia candida TaxID=158441 RepID=A0A226DDI9_FOLCA|nr:Mite allergen Der p 3 [Folsomia candida]
MLTTATFSKAEYFVIYILLVTVQRFETAPNGKDEYDFEEVTLDQEVTPSVDVEYHTEEPRTAYVDPAWECGRSPVLNGVDSYHPPDFLTGDNSDNNGNSQTPRKKVPPGLIINGTEVQRGEIPWMVAITKYQYNRVPRWKVVCGGVLLNDRFVLTASHCLQGRYKDTLEVVFNVDDSSLITNDVRVIRRKIKRVILHPEYNSVTIDNDIALIEITKPLEISEVARNVWPVCLPAHDDEDYSHIGTVAGWGYTKWIENKAAPANASAYLRKVYIPILTHEECLQTKLPSKNNVTENMLCAGYVEDGGKDSCLNDSGGPLTVEENGRTRVVGIVSWGIGCGLKGYPGVYTRVMSMRN